MRNLTNHQLQAEYDTVREQITSGMLPDERMAAVFELDDMEAEAADRGFWLRRT